MTYGEFVLFHPGKKNKVAGINAAHPQSSFLRINQGAGDVGASSGDVAASDLSTGAARLAVDPAARSPRQAARALKAAPLAWSGQIARSWHFDELRQGATSIESAISLLG